LAQTDSVIQFVSIQNVEHLNTAFNESALTANQKYRIIHFGDSHIQGDRITGEIRTHLQSLYGSGGSGMIFPYSLTGSFGPVGTLSKVKGTYTYSSQLKNPTSQRIGIMGYELKLKNGSEFTMSFNEKFNGKLTDEVDIWIHSTSDSLSLSFQLENGTSTYREIDDGLRVYTIKSPKTIDTIRFSVNDECSLWGIELVSNSGLVYQQSGVVGAQFSHLIKHKKDVLKQLKQIEPNLLIFSYGTNESYSNLDTLKYEASVTEFLKELKLLLPKASILLTNAPDTRSGGRTPSNELSVNRRLESVSRELGIAFFDANTAMGGWGSLYAWNKKGYFNKDLLHFSSVGAKLFGKLLLHALLDDMNKANEFNEKLEAEIKEYLPKIESEQKQEAAFKPVSEEIPKRKESNFYIVKNGDTLGKIAQKKGCSINYLVKRNKLQSADRIQPGQKIYY
jgi:lysophospholipase L1-like esterase